MAGTIVERDGGGVIAIKAIFIIVSRVILGISASRLSRPSRLQLAPFMLATPLDTAAALLRNTIAFH